MSKLLPLKPHTRRAPPKCCKVGRARLRARVGSIYYELVFDYDINPSPYQPIPGISFCPWCGKRLIP